MSVDHQRHSDKILRCIADGVITTDMQGVVSYMNPVAERLTGIATEEACGQHFTSIVRLKRDDDGHTVMREDGNKLTSNHVASLFAHNDKQYSVSYSMTALQDEKGGSLGFVIVLHDITREYDLTKKLEWQSLHDALTSLKNRRAFELRVQSLLNDAGDDDVHSLLFLALDRFKVVNDTCGHQAGDRFLKQIGGLLNKQLRSADMLARIGGDEFAIVLADCPVRRATEIATRLLDVVNQTSFSWDDKTFDIGISIGVVPVDQTPMSFSDVLKAADMSCHAAKGKGGNCIHVYSSEDSDITKRNNEMRWLQKLHSALESESFVLFRQVIKPTRKDAIYECLYEFLVRLWLPEQSTVAPNDFIPVAERYGLMLKLDRWVVRQAFSVISADASSQKTLFNINLSGQSLADETFLGFVVNEIKASGVTPESVCFEITETALINCFNTAKHFIEELRRIGCKFALDDFGTGLSSFAYLKHFKVDFIKVDGEFITHLKDDLVDQTMVKIIQIAASDLGISTVAEWVEDDATLEILNAVGVDYVQGYGIGRPEEVGTQFLNQAFLQSASADPHLV
ncbi:MAG: EAL domain-containing protein [Gammaproteobacteria bacterium]|nr:MAG: EAL domain-containing protein [Gammaproteobacteria bacterium]